jgi:hypothetical protein
VIVNMKGFKTIKITKKGKGGFGAFIKKGKKK